jgi:hypothetical protein
MGCKCARFDAAGHRILPVDAMRLYYKSDDISMKILSSHMSFQYVVIPGVEIRLSTEFPGNAIIYLIYPGETKEREVEFSSTALQGLRRTYRGKPGWEVDTRLRGWIIFRRDGRVILDPKKRYEISRA